MKFLDQLQNPPREFTAIPFWFLNGELTAEELRRQLADFAAHGIYGVVLHPRVAKIYDDRRKMASGEQPGDWGFAENLAYATLLDAGNRLRLVFFAPTRGLIGYQSELLTDTRGTAVNTVGAISRTFSGTVSGFSTKFRRAPV